MIKMLTEELLSEVIELLESSIQYRDFEYVKEALIVLKEQDDADSDLTDSVDHHYNNDYYNEIRENSNRKKQIKKLKKKSQ